MNETLKKAAQSILKDLLHRCTEDQRNFFKRMYSHKDLDLPIDKVVEQMDESKYDHAITQCENQVKKNEQETDYISSGRISFERG